MSNKMTSITLKLENDKQFSCHIDGKSDFPTVLTIVSSFTLGYANAVRQRCKEEHPEDLEKVTEEIYDLINNAASNLLALFAPELELRPDLTAEAILKAENEILDSLPEDTKEEQHD